jgi:hypothetical protein
MKLPRRTLTGLALIFSAHSAFAMELVSSGALFAREHSRASAWTTARLCNGISKHTRTICCGTNPPAWCGKQPESDILPHETDDAFGHEAVVPRKQRSGDQRMLILRDPVFYACMITSITVIYLTALAGSGRDNGVEEGA